MTRLRKMPRFSRLLVPTLLFWALLGLASPLAKAQDGLEGLAGIGQEGPVPEALVPEGVVPEALDPAGERPEDSIASLCEAVIESLVSSKVNDRDAAIAAVAEDRSDAATELLRALLEGRLMADRGAKSLYLVDSEGGHRDLLSGAAIGDIGGLNLRKVGINNRQRESLVSIINNRTLLSPDLGVRRRAAAALVSSKKVDPALIGELLAKESDGEVIRSYEKILAIDALQDKGASEGELISALNFLGDNLTPEAREYMRAYAESENPEIAKVAAAAMARQDNKLQHIAFFETVFFGLSLGSVLVLIGIGLAITFGVMGVINMAHGEMVMLGAYTVWALQSLLPGQAGLALILAIPVSFVVTGLVGAILELSIIRYLYSRPLETLLATYGVSLVLQQAVKIFISSNNRSVETPKFMSGLLYLSDHLTVTYSRLYIIGFCLVVFLMINLVMKRTRLGLEVRAVTQNRAMAQAMGVNSRRVDTFTFVLGSGVAGMAGVALSQLTNVGPNLGQSYIVDSFMVVVFGGVGNLWGTFLGGLIIGMANKFIEPINGAIMAKILIMVGIILFIQRHPSGLFPQKGRAA
ncbi:MAG: urea ABC transporter permease subunit UrtB, partial [Deltaproteobacteria bacterium]|nr:urea ABC transporter permease subunit UrtB [Deltaproteobacteria bacterium]